MNEQDAAGPAGARPEQAHDPPEREWLELKMLLIGREQERLSRIEKRLNSTVIRTEEVGDVLPAIIARGIEKNPVGVSEALLLVIGPAIRSMISAALQDMLRNLDRILQYGLSPTSWKWRLEALRTGKPFGEIVLLHSLQYRVEQVFLVHRRTSLVIRHVEAPSARGRDPDLVSAMLSAIQDFVHHSFDSDLDARLHVVQAGDLTIWVEQGPLAFLAVAIRGDPPLELRAQFRSVLEQIHVKYASELQKFNGDPAPMESCTELLERCLVFELNEQAQPKKPVFALGFCTVLMALIVVASILTALHAQRWKAYVAELNKEPGIMVTSATSGILRQSIAGLSDPLGADPMQMLRRASIDPRRVQADWRPYVSAAPEMVLLRARRRLNPPPGLSLAYEGGTLRAFGTAPVSWTSDVGKGAMSIPGVERFDTNGVESLETHQLEKQKTAVESILLFFARDSAVLTEQQREVAQNAVAAIDNLTKLADTVGKTAVVRVIGRADRDGGIRENLALSRKRARIVTTVLLAHGLKASWLEAMGVGTTQPLRPGVSEADKAYNRTVGFDVTWRGSEDQGSKP